ncbi:DUF5805 domain-containing protein [Halobaculum sp. CBA1158]|uniref:DUF5805 domain-containing protein n=1 Tax=Halobaculum sp. CBA1158 TaxID=2904243 RepID=UPI001F464FAF|nr:DUF5805 domain-containing protein [Halobaculum sp. CBA1158]UIO98937.1 DUF5805 domain-containing protein [Halobaculum sp. CBA1158]
MSDAEAERVPVTVRVPAYQKRAWVAEADGLDMSQSEFVRTMVQAGRRDLGVADAFGPPPGAEESDESADPSSESSSAEGASPPTNPGGSNLEERLLEALANEDVMSFDGLVEAVAGDIEERVDETMGRLQSRGRVRYSGRDGGYVLVEQ